MPMDRERRSHARPTNPQIWGLADSAMLPAGRPINVDNINDGRARPAKSASLADLALAGRPSRSSGQLGHLTGDRAALRAKMRDDLAHAIEAAIALLDQLDGDPDLEDADTGLADRGALDLAEQPGRWA